MADDKSKNRLGRGLAALIGELDQPVSAAQPAETSEPMRADNRVPIEHIRANPANPRRHFTPGELDDLTGSIREHGIVQPILVRPVKEGDLAGAKYEIVAGERRWRAAQKAGLHEVPVVIRELEDKQALEIAIIENVQRSDLNPIEEAQGYQQLIDGYDYSQNELAQAISKSRSHVANTLRLLKLPDDLQSLVMQGKISAGHARTLVTAEDPVGLAQRIVTEGLSVRQAEALAQAVPQDDRSDGSGDKARKSSDIVALERRLEEALGLKISLDHRADSTGVLKIKYRTLEQLDEVCRRLETGL